MIKAGFAPEFPEREDGFLGIQKLYDIQFSKVNIMQSELRYAAVNSGKIILVDAYSTDCELRRYDLTVLEDDKHFFPSYQGVPLLKKKH